MTKVEAFSQNPWLFRDPRAETDLIYSDIAANPQPSFIRNRRSHGVYNLVARFCGPVPLRFTNFLAPNMGKQAETGIPLLQSTWSPTPVRKRGRGYSSIHAVCCL